MLYVIIDKEDKVKVLLVKARDRDEIDERLKLSPSQEVAGSFTTSEVQALDSSSFVIISGS